MLDIYAKNEKSDLTPADKRELRAIVSLLEGSQWHGVNFQRRNIQQPVRG
jgi:hypothetical protein